MRCKASGSIISFLRVGPLNYTNDDAYEAAYRAWREDRKPWPLKARDARDARKRERATGWIDVLWRDRIGRTSIQAISEFYAVATRKLGIPAERAWIHAERYFAWNPCPVDEALLRRREASVAYAVERRTRSLHRPRGRPKRAGLEP